MLKELQNSTGIEYSQLQDITNPKVEIYQKKREKAIKASPKTDRMTPVQIDSKTTIYVKKGECPEEAKKRFLAKHKH